MLIIGYGNDLRRDDGAGRLLAARLAQEWRAAGHPVELRLVQQLAPELALELAAETVETVLFVDARAGGADDAQLAPLHVAAGSASLGHQLDPTVLLAYAAGLYAARPRAWLLSVPGVDFSHGEGFSQEAAQRVEDTVAQADALWRRLHSPHVK